MEDLRRISLWTPLLLLLVLELLRRYLLEPWLGSEQASLAFMVGAGAGVVIFSAWMFGLIERARKGERRALAEAEARYQEVEALRQASSALVGELELDAVLEKVVSLSREVVRARYGALGVLDDAGETITNFVTSGIDEETRERLGDPPTGHGILGLVIEEGTAVRLDDLTNHPKSVGFPPGHPPMRSFLGVPVVYQDTILGNIYLTEKEDGTFSRRDEEILEQFAAQAAVAITNARLFEQTEHMAVLEERERIGMDLHDGTIQSLYALGLTLEGVGERLQDEPEAVAQELDQAINILGRIIGDIRHYIFDLKVEQTAGRPFRGQLEDLVAALRLEERLSVAWDWDVPQGLEPDSRDVRATVLHIMREALTNAVRHARATTVTLRAEQGQGELRLAVIDDGEGFEPDREFSENLDGRGLRNMEARARMVGAELEIASETGAGTEVTIRVPLEEVVKES